MDKTDIEPTSQVISEDGSNWGKSHNWNWQGIRSHWRVLGENNEQTILLLHGFGASSSHWRKNAQPFVDAGFKVYGLDLIGFGASEQPNRKTIRKLDNYVWSQQVSAFLEEVVQSNKNRKTILIGNSLGGLTALTTLFFRPQLVAAVIAAPLPDPAFMQQSKSSYSLWAKNLSDFLLKVFFELLPLEILIPLISRTCLIKKALQIAYYESIDSDKELLRMISKPAQKRTAARALRSMCIGMSTRRKEYTAPILINKLEDRDDRSPILLIWGKQDKLVPLSIGKQLIGEHPWLNLFVLEKTGHCPHDELPNEFNQYVLKWLDTNLGGDNQLA